MEQKSKITINPGAFTNGGWAELYYGSTLIPRGVSDLRREAKPFTRSPRTVTQTVRSLLLKVQEIKEGQYGAQDAPGQDRRWIAELKRVAKILEGYLASA